MCLFGQIISCVSALAVDNLAVSHVFTAKVRRLYDIANVLRSLKFIEKVHVTEERGRKPAFEWVGPQEFPEVKGIARPLSPPDHLVIVHILVHN